MLLLAFDEVLDEGFGQGPAFTRFGASDWEVLDVRLLEGIPW